MPSNIKNNENDENDTLSFSWNALLCDTLTFLCNAIFILLIFFISIIISIKINKDIDSKMLKLINYIDETNVSCFQHPEICLNMNETLIYTERVNTKQGSIVRMFHFNKQGLNFENITLYKYFISFNESDMIFRNMKFVEKTFKLKNINFQYTICPKDEIEAFKYYSTIE